MKKELLIVEKKVENGKSYFLLANFISSNVFTESELKLKLKNNEISVVNYDVNSNGNILILPNSQNIQNERDLFYLSIIDKIDVCLSDYNSCSDFLSRLKRINKRKITFNSDISLRKLCISYLKSYFHYLGKTKYKFLKTNYEETMFFLDREFIKNISVEIRLNIPEYLNNSSYLAQLSDLSNPYHYSVFLRILEDLWSQPYSDKRKKKISFVLDIIEQFFDHVKYNCLSSYLYQNYLLTLSKVCMDGFENHTEKYLPNINERDRINILNETAGVDNETYYKRIDLIKENSRKVNALVRQNNLGINKLLHCFSDIDEVTRVEEEDLKKYLTKEMEKVQKEYLSLIKSLNELGNKKGKNAIDTLSFISDIKDLTSLADFKFATPLLAGFGGFVVLKEKLKTGLETCAFDALSVESLGMYNRYQKLSLGEQGVLNYLVDKARCLSVSRKRAEKLRLYSDKYLLPLLDLMYYKENYFFNEHIKTNYYENEKCLVEISWLSSYYILGDKIDRNSLYVRENIRFIYWKLFEECFKIALPEKNIRDFKMFCFHTSDVRHWGIYERVYRYEKLNLYKLLKDYERRV